MYVWTSGDIAKEYEVARGTVSYWIKVWGPDSDHPFPEPVAKVQIKYQQQIRLDAEIKGVQPA